MKNLKQIRDKRLRVICMPQNGTMGMGIIKDGDFTASVVFGTHECGWEHVSISPFGGTMPTWDQMCTIKDIFWHEEETVVQIHPKKSEYVNIMQNCLHLWKAKTPDVWATLGKER